MSIIGPIIYIGIQNWRARVLEIAIGFKNNQIWYLENNKLKIKLLILKIRVMWSDLSDIFELYIWLYEMVRG